MVCSPGDLSLNPPVLGAPPNLGFGPLFAPLQIPFPDISLPAGVPEDILELLQSIFAIIPGGKLVPNADDAFRTVFAAISSLLNQLGPYLAFYNFIQALLEMVMCILDVLCALMNPFATIAAVIRLFKRCIPNFLSLFPFLALIAMILAFILLLIALIEFLINYVIAIINDLIANIVNLSEAFQVGDEAGIIAITQKLASLTCLIEQAFALLIAFQALFAIIQALAQIGGRKPCGECCGDELCPPFIANSPDGVSGTAGRLVYHKEVSQDISALPIAITIPALRNERWQFVDDAVESFPFSDIITPIQDNIYWPQPFSFSKGDNLKIAVPYTVDMRLKVDPTVFGHSSTNGSFTGSRYFRIKDAIVTVQPYKGVLAHDNELDLFQSFGNSSGTLSLVGGVVFEDDEATSFIVDGEQASLDTFITQTKSSANTLPASEDGYQISDIEYTMQINHAALMKYQLITAGCVPEVQTETAIIDASNPDISAIIDRIGELPDLTGTLDCLNSAIDTFRQDVSLESAATLQSNIVGCLNDLKEQSEEVFKNTFIAGVSPFTSDVTLDPEVQFVDSPIKVSVQLRDAGGNNISTNIPEAAREQIEEKLKAEVTLGAISDFNYDGSELFVADITSDKPGTGTLQVSFDGSFLSEVLNRDTDVPSEIITQTFPYQFVGGFRSGEDDPLERRDERDVGNA